VLNVKTGGILAMANVPSYNPNDRPKIHDGRFRNRAVTDTFEPGSTMKPFAVAVALASGKYTPYTMIDTTPGWYMLSGHKVEDTHNKGNIDVTQVLQYSSNVGVSKMILSLPPNLLPDFLRKIGFGVKTSSGFPGESHGNFKSRTAWKPFSLATLSFGYGIAVTTLQLAHAYSILANYGVELPLSFLKLNEAPEGKRVMQAKFAQQILRMLETVVEPGGTAPLARVAGYWVSGKTGTSRIVGPHGYEWNHHNAVFAGVAPATNPQLVVVVFIHDPKKITYYGGYVSGPVFSKVMSAALRILDIAPDHLPGMKQP
jgi:cell division protein FtsI (penicillin-binding protein 3)